jgi:hypothetical protein
MKKVEKLTKWSQEQSNRQAHHGICNLGPANIDTLGLDVKWVEESSTVVIIIFDLLVTTMQVVSVGEHQAH